MKVILLKNVESIGKKFDVKEVSDGYARNFLLPNKLAKIATPVELQKLETEKKKNKDKAEMDLAKVEELIAKMDGTEVVFDVKVSNGSKLYEAVTSRMIDEETKENGFAHNTSHVHLIKPNM